MRITGEGSLGMSTPVGRVGNSVPLTLTYPPYLAAKKVTERLRAECACLDAICKAAVTAILEDPEKIADHMTSYAEADAKWISIKRLLGELEPKLEALRAEAQRLAEWDAGAPERERQEREREAQRVEAQKIWQHPNNAHRIVRETLTGSGEFERRQKEQITCFVPENLFTDEVFRWRHIPTAIRRGDTSKGEPYMFVTAPEALARWVEDHAAEILSSSDMKDFEEKLIQRRMKEAEKRAKSGVVNPVERLGPGDFIYYSPSTSGHSR